MGGWAPGALWEGRKREKKNDLPLSSLNTTLSGHLGSLTNAHAPSHPAHSQAHMWWLQRQPDFQHAFPAKKEGDE